MGETRGDHSIDIAINSGDESSKPCIFKVPAKLRRHSPKSYIPELFSIGPLHHTQEHLKETEVIKKHYLFKLLTRKPTPRTTQEEFKTSILKVEGRARKCYAFPTDHLNKDEFVDMLVLDGCFIIELLKYGIDYNTLDEDDPIFSVSWVLPALYHDLILLENQIPWFVLECLFDMTSEKILGTKSLTELALDFFDTIFTRDAFPSILDVGKINHILDLLRNSLIYSSRIREKWQGSWQQIPTAATLKESGIRFKKAESRALLDITFDIKHGVLEIPPLLIDEIKCEAFQNIISYEQCYTYCEAEITSYAVLLDNLINTRTDINVLREAGVFHNWLNTKDTVEFFNSIYTDNYVKGFYYSQICDQVNEYRNRWWPRTRVAYARMFRDPIGSLSLFAATIALILTLLQTLFTILQYIDSR